MVWFEVLVPRLVLNWTIWLGAWPGIRVASILSIAIALKAHSCTTAGIEIQCAWVRLEHHSVTFGTPLEQLAVFLSLAACRSIYPVDLFWFGLVVWGLSIRAGFHRSHGETGSCTAVPLPMAAAAVTRCFVHGTLDYLIVEHYSTGFVTAAAPGFVLPYCLMCFAGFAHRTVPYCLFASLFRSLCQPPPPPHPLTVKKTCSAIAEGIGLRDAGGYTRPKGGACFGYSSL